MTSCFNIKLQQGSSFRNVALINVVNDLKSTLKYTRFFTTIQNVWITKGITKYSKKKQKFYCFEKRTRQNEQKCKNYKNLFETIKSKAKKIYYSNKLLYCTGDIKKTWNVMKDFNDFFVNIDQKLASQIPKSSKTFETYINKVNVIADSKPLSIRELKETFFSLKVKKSSGVDVISFDIIKKCFWVFYEPLIYLFQLSIEKGVFSDDLKISRVTPIYKAGDSGDISNYGPISVLERLMHNHLYKY